ncbi:MAG: hypothetical protein QOG76_3149, partial [Pseudonocardiales bacterium]|nr:hypothetical protein [Pseudonocardiales bacterium]
MTDPAVTQADSIATPTYQWYAGGQWRTAPGVFDDFEPYTGDVFA